MTASSIFCKRPETVKSQQTCTDVLTRYRMKAAGVKIAEGRIGGKVGIGPARADCDCSGNSFIS
jgi:hypothetical protein